MFLVKDPDTSYFVFVAEDPRKGGFKGEVQDDVTFEDGSDLTVWPEGQDGPEPTLGVARNNPKHYRGFHSPKQCEEAGFNILTTLSFTNDFLTWSDYKAFRDKA